MDVFRAKTAILAVGALTGFLLSANASAITGQQIVMCGGASL
ncbi:hypothetical protein [Burkholderia ambifaria]|nr:enoyl-[acyl-carrier-protein] reductase (NADH) [Burkholderia contaminans]